MHTSYKTRHSNLVASVQVLLYTTAHHGTITVMDAKVVAIDGAGDLALLWIAGNNYPFIRPCKRAARTGDRICAIGDPSRLDFRCCIDGIVRDGNWIGANVQTPSFVLTTIPTNPGMSGAPSVEHRWSVCGHTLTLVP